MTDHLFGPIDFLAYRELSTVPETVRAIWEEGRLVNRDVLKWENDAPPPPIGAEIEVTMNKIGRATVRGYFVEGNWLGLLVRLHNPPDWHKKQNKGDPTGHIFGPEFRLAQGV